MHHASGTAKNGCDCGVLCETCDEEIVGGTFLGDFQVLRCDEVLPNFDVLLDIFMDGGLWDEG